MKLNRKLDYVFTAVKSISDHTDDDGAVRAAALDRVIAFVTEEKARIDAAVKAEIEAALAP